MSRTQANALLFAATLMWGLGNVAQKTVLLHLEPFAVAGARSLIGLAVILPFFVREWRRKRPTAGRVAATFLPPSIMFSMAFVVLQIGYSGTSVTNASFLVCADVLFTPLIAFVALREKPKAATSIAAVLAAFGVFLMTDGMHGFTWGDGCCLIAAFLFSVWVVLVARSLRRCNLPFALAAYQFAFAAVVGLTIGLIGEPITLAAVRTVLLELAFLGIASTGLAFSMHAIAQPWTSASDAVVVMSAESVCGALAAAAMLGERPTAAAVAGGALIVGAITLVQLKSWAKRAFARAFPPHGRTPQLPASGVRSRRVIPEPLERGNPERSIRGQRRGVQISVLRNAFVGSLGTAGKDHAT